MQALTVYVSACREFVGYKQKAEAESINRINRGINRSVYSGQLLLCTINLEKKSMYGENLLQVGSPHLVAFATICHDIFLRFYQIHHRCALPFQFCAVLNFTSADLC